MQGGAIVHFVVIVLTCTPSGDTLTRVQECIVDIAERYVPLGSLLLVSGPEDPGEQCAGEEHPSLHSRGNGTDGDPSAQGRLLERAKGENNTCEQGSLLHKISKFDDVVAALFGARLWPIMTAGNGYNHSNNPMVGDKAFAIVILHESGNFSDHLDGLRRHPVWTLRARVVVLTSAEAPDAAKHLLALLWNQKAADAIVVLPSLHVYSWLAYHSSAHCGGPVQKTLLLDHWQHGRFKEGANLFVDKVPKDLHGCPVNISTFTWPPFVFPPIYKDAKNVNVSSEFKDNDTVTIHFTEGIEIQLIETVAEATNFKIDYVKTPEGDWSTLVDHTLIGKSEVALAAIPPHLDKYPGTDVTTSYMKLPFAWFVPKEKPIPRWKNLIRVFSPTFWLLVIFSYGLGAVTQFLLGSRRDAREHDAYSDPTASFLGALAVVLGVSVSAQPRSGVLRLFFILWVLYCLQINTAYQSMLIVVLTNPGLEPPITNVREMLASDLSGGYTRRLQTVLTEMNDGQFDELLRKFHLCVDSKGCLHRVAYQQNYAFVTVRTFGEFMMETEYWRDGKSLIKPLLEDVFVSDIHMCLSKGSLLLVRFDDLIGRVLQSGIMVKWWKDLKRRFQPSRTHRDGDDKWEDEGVAVLNVTHLQPVFQLLALGLAVSSCAFLGELLVYKLQKKLKIKRHT